MQNCENAGPRVFILICPCRFGTGGGGEAPAKSKKKKDKPASLNVTRVCELSEIKLVINGRPYKKKEVEVNNTDYSALLPGGFDEFYAEEETHVADELVNDRVKRAKTEQEQVEALTTGVDFEDDLQSGDPE
jgi:hypothetical protein